MSYLSGEDLRIGGTISGGTQYSVLFVDPNNVIAQDNANFRYNNSTNSLLVGGTSGNDILTLGAGAAGVDYDFLKVNGETSDLLFKWYEDERVLKMKSDTDTIGVSFGEPSTALFNVLNILTSVNISAAGFVGTNEGILFISSKGDTGIIGGSIVAGLRETGSTIVAGNMLMGLWGGGETNPASPGDLPTAAKVNLEGDGTWSSSSTPSRIVFLTNPTGVNGAPVEAMRINKSGLVSIGGFDSVSKLHIDGGTATASDLRFTAGTTTGRTSSDGFQFGIDASGNAEIRQRENLPITLYTNNTAWLRVDKDGKTIAGDTTDTANFFPTTDTKFQVGREITSIGTSVSPIDIIKLLSVSAAIVNPSADTNSSLGVSIYGAQGFNMQLNGSHNFNGGLPIGTTVYGAMSALGAFGQVNIATSGSLDGAAGLLCSVTHQGGGSNATKIIGGVFESGTDDAASPGTPTGAMGEAIGGVFNVGAGGVNITSAESGRFYEPSVYDAGNGYGTASSITNKTAVSIRGTASIIRSTVASAASITNMAVDSSHVHITGSTTTAIHGIHADTFAKTVWLYNATNTTVTLKHQSTTDGTAANRIIVSTGSDYIIQPGAWCQIFYDTNASRWKIVTDSESGTYTPTLTNVANLTASTAYQCQYMRIGTTVSVSGKVDVDPTTTTTATQLGISLPIASNIGAVEDCAGTAFSSAIAGQGAAILGDAANNRAEMNWNAVDITNQPMYFTFQYQIL